MSNAARRVAVIGAGPAGAIATEALVKEQAFETIRVFDKQHVAGGTWVWTSDKRQSVSPVEDLLENCSDLPVALPSIFPCETDVIDRSNDAQHMETAAHKHLHSNLPPEVMAFSQEPIPLVLSEHTRKKYGPSSPFRHRELIRDWVEAIFTRGNHQGLIEFNTTVERAEKSGQIWVLTLRKPVAGASKDYWWQETFDAVVVATGHYHLPFLPAFPGLTEYDRKFPGKIKHTKSFQVADEFAGKRVLVVGGSVSAFDALHDIRQVSELPIISSLRRPSPVFGWAAFQHPDIENRPAISSFNPDTGRITFTDESFVDDIDAVVFATGYEFSFPFLPNIKPVNRRIPGLYEHVFKIDDPSLTFVGMVTGGFGLRIFEWQAVAVARILAGRGSLPSRKEMEEWEKHRLSEVGDGIPFWSLMPDFETHFEALRAIAGDPVAGTTGRVLAPYDPEWEGIFWKFVKDRILWWEREAADAEKKRSLLQHSSASGGS